MLRKLQPYITQIRGVSYKPSDIKEPNEGVIILRANNIRDDQINFDELVYVSGKKVSDLQYLRNGDVLICTSSGSGNLVGKAAVYSDNNEDVSFGAFCKVIRIEETEEILPEYIRMFFLSKNYREQIMAYGIGANIKNIKAEHFDALKIGIPSKQKQIVAVSEIRTLLYALNNKKNQLQLLDDLVKSRFIEMFGDPMENSNGYKLQKYGDVFELNAGGTPSKSKKEYWENGTISWIGSNLCQNVVLYENDGQYITNEGLNHSSARLFPVDTVLIALVGATIGKTALLKFETTTNQNVLGVRGIKENGYNPYFVYYYTQGLYPKFLSIGDGGFAMASKGFISALPIPVVDIKLQNDFEIFAQQVDKSKFIVQQQINELQELLDKKMDEYFG